MNPNHSPKLKRKACVSDPAQAKAPTPRMHQLLLNTRRAPRSTSTGALLSLGLKEDAAANHAASQTDPAWDQLLA